MSQFGKPRGAARGHEISNCLPPPKSHILRKFSVFLNHFLSISNIPFKKKPEKLVVLTQFSSLLNTRMISALNHCKYHHY